MVCSCDAKCSDVTMMELRHGKPDAFEEHIWGVWADCWITYDEAVLAIQKYRWEYLQMLNSQ